MQKAPFCIYADFETQNVKAKDTDDVFEYDENWDPFEENWWHLPNPKEAFKMLTQKGVYPYGYMDSFGKNIS